MEVKTRIIFIECGIFDPFDIKKITFA
jgi:hypothetical protein